jgi:hypothetical protein
MSADPGLIVELAERLDGATGWSGERRSRSPSRAKTKQSKEEAEDSASHGLRPMTRQCAGLQP